MQSISSSSPLRHAGGQTTGRAAHRGLTEAVTCGLLCALTLVFAWPVTALGQLPTSTDFILQYYPNLAFLARELRAGELPLWNPALFAGTPYLADPQSQLLYFPNWPFLLALDLQDAARAIVIVHFALAAVAAYAYLRHLRLPVPAAFLGATVYGLGPYATAQVAWLPMLISMAWMPIALLLFEQALERRSLTRAALAAAVLALQFFNGWPHGSYITAFALVAVFAWHASAMAARRGWRPLAGLFGVSAATGATAFAMAAPVLLPFLEFWQLSNYASDRGALAAASEGSVTALALAGLGGTEGHGAYLGVLGLLLAALGVLKGKDRRRWLYLLVASFGILVAFGANTPLYGVLYTWVPGFRTFHMPGRFMVLFVFGASVLAGMGTEALLRLAPRQLVLSALAGAAGIAVLGAYALVRTVGPDAPVLLAANLLRPDSGPFLNQAVAMHIAVAAAVASAFLALLATGMPRGTSSAMLAFLVLTADLLTFQGTDAHYFASLPVALKEPGPAAEIGKLNGDGDFRVAGFQQTGQSQVLSDFPFNLNGGLVPPNLSLLYGLDDLQGYLPLRLRSYADYLAAINGGQDDYHWGIVHNFQSSLLDMLNLRYVMLRGNEDRLSNVTIATNPAVSAGSPATLETPPLTVTALTVRSFLGNATALENGHVVAVVRASAASGDNFSFDLRAGRETAEWAYDRPDVLSRVRHDRAPIASTRNLPSPTHEYLGTFTFTRPITLSQVVVEQVDPTVSLTVTEIAAVPANAIPRYERAGEIDGATLYRNVRALPRVLMVPGSEGAPTGRAALERIQSPGFDPRKSVVLEGSAALAREAASPESAWQVQTVRRGADRLRVAVSGTSPGFLVLNELSYPGWKAYLDGRQVPVWRANYLFRAIEVPPGDHDIEFSFEPDSLKLGLALFLSTPAFLLVTAALRLRSRKKKESVPL